MHRANAKRKLALLRAIDRSPAVQDTMTLLGEALLQLLSSIALDSSLLQCASLHSHAAYTYDSFSVVHYDSALRKLLQRATTCSAQDSGSVQQCHVLEALAKGNVRERCTIFMNLIFKVVGSPSYATVMSMCSSNAAAQRFLNGVTKTVGVNFWELFPGADPGALDLLRTLLAFDPKERASAADALRHPYFAGLHDAEDEPVFHGARFQGAAYLNCDTEDFRKLIFEEIKSYHPELA